MDNNLIYNKFKNIYFSVNNKTHITNNVINNSTTLTFDSQHLTDLQIFIFDNYFTQIYNEYLLNNDNIDYNYLLTYINDFTISKFKILYNTLLSQNNQIPPYDTQEITQPQIIQKESLIEPNPLNIPKDLPIEITQPHPIERPHEEYTEEVNYNIFSKHSSFKNGDYNIKYNIKNVQSLLLKNINIMCNLYNINENSKITIEEEKNKIDILIPIGYYNVKELIQCINETIKKNTLLRNEYSITLHKNKNKIYIKSNKNFNIYFNTNLLGFSKKEYLNNNNYISENFPYTNIYDNLYIKLFINDTYEIVYNNSNSNFTFYYNFQTKYNSNFGNKIFKNTDLDNYYFDNSKINIGDIKIEFYDSNRNKITKYIDFEMLFSFQINSI